MTLENFFRMEDEPICAEADISLYRATLRKQLQQKLNAIGFDHEKHRRIALALTKKLTKKEEERQLAEANLYLIMSAVRFCSVEPREVDREMSNE